MVGGFRFAWNYCTGMTDSPPPTYVGRFAPTPSGPLHFGSVVAAVGSFLDARRQGGAWLLRIDDVDRPRSVPGAADDILRTLERLGLVWDGAPVRQHERVDRYEAALAQLVESGAVYGCACTRKQLQDGDRAADGSVIYPGTCAAGLAPGLAPRAWRFRVPASVVRFEDRVQGVIVEDLRRDVGDFVLKRADGLFAYQLATVVDDADAGVTDVVRGIDLMLSTPRQIALQQALGLPIPRYGHFPVVVDAAGQKLSKQSLARAVHAFAPTQLVFDALCCLGQTPPDELVTAPLSELWQWALAHWSMQAVPRVSEVTSRSDYDR